MLHCIKTKTVAVGLFYYPLRPECNLFGYRVIAEIDIVAHQEVIVAIFTVDLVVPAVAGIIIDDFKNAIFVRVFSMIYAAKTVEIPDKGGVLTRTAWKSLAGPGLIFNTLFINMVTIVRVNAVNRQ